MTSQYSFPVWDLTFSPDGMLLAAGGVGSTSVYNLAAVRRIAVLPARGSAGITSVAFSPDGRTLTATTDGAADIQMWDLVDNAGTSTYVWDVATRRPAAVLAFPMPGSARSRSARTGGPWPSPMASWPVRAGGTATSTCGAGQPAR